MSQINKEFQGPSELSNLDRRDFMKYLGVFSSMSFLANCSRPAEKIIPFSKEISEFSERNYEYYTTAMNQNGFAQGLLIKSFQGRPIKVEGNPNHPFSLGATSPEAQAILYDLYHPNRLQDLIWEKKKYPITQLQTLIEKETLSWGDGQNVAFVFQADHSPTQNQLITEVQKRFPKSKWTSISPWKIDSLNKQDLLNIDVVVSFDEELFFNRPDYLKISKEFMSRRKRAIDSNSPIDMNALFVLQSAPTLSGAKADKIYTQTREMIWNDAVELFEILKGKNIQNERMQTIAKNLKNKNSVVFINKNLHKDAIFLETSINRLLKAETTYYKYSLPENTKIDELLQDMGTGKIKSLIMIDANPVYWNEEFKKVISKVPLKISLSLWDNDTTKASDVVIAKSHFLESWGDLIGPDKTISIQQPLIEPIFHSVSTLTFLSLFTGKLRNSYDIINEVYQAQWAELLSKGFIKSNTKEDKPTPLSQFEKVPLQNSIIVKVLPDYSMGFGENFKNPILQELPKSFSRITWQNAFYVNENMAREYKLKNFDVIELSSGKSKNQGPVMIVPGVAEKTIVATLGYGQDKRGTNNFIFTDGEVVTITKTLKTKKLALFQDDLSTDGRNPVKTAKLPLVAKIKKPLVGLYPDHPLPHQEKGPQWAMTIDLTTCIGCQACVLACQVENNIPFVGEDQAAKSRIMHWLRVDTYQVNDKTYFQPVPCMHCEKAPCEVVCPVNATVHGNGGLNEMVYNRCVGTRYCSNNCPYRVRRFNFKAYSILKSPQSLGFNPDVSVRERGVMEKCTYCIQRIREGEIKNETSKVKTACAQVCPTEAIVFGDLKDEKSKLVKEKSSPRHYDLLEEEGTVPRTSYLKVIRYEES